MLLSLLPVLLGRCSPSGDSSFSTSLDAPSPQVERQAIAALVQLYRAAVVQEDIDRVQALLAPNASPLTAQAAQGSATRQAADGTFATLRAFRAHLSATFRTPTVTALDALEDQIQIASDRHSVTFLEVESTEDPSRRVHQTRVYRTTFQLVRIATATTVRFRIGAATRQGPLAQITTPGQVQAGTLARVTVSDPLGEFPLASGMMQQHGAAAAQPLQLDGPNLTGTVAVPNETSTTTVQITLQSRRGKPLTVTHTLRVRHAGDDTVQPIAGTAGRRLQAVTVARDGTVWAGGTNRASLYSVAPGRPEAALVGQLVNDPSGRIEDLVEDDRGRVQAVIFGQQTSGIVVHAQGVFCQTVPVVDPSYPFQTTDGQPGASTRAIVAGAEAIWLHGSDDGIAQVTDEVPPGQPMGDADVAVFGTPWHVVTDANGQFTLRHLPAGTYQLLVDGQLASGGPFALAVRALTVTTTRQTLAPISVPMESAVVVIDPARGGQVTFPLMPGAALTIPPQGGTHGPLELRLRFVAATGLPDPLPVGFTAAVAAELQPDGTTFSTPVTLTLPNHTGLPAGQLVVLMHFDADTQTYEQVGLGRVSADGSVIHTLSGGLTQFSTVVYAATGVNATKVFLVPVSGNNQRVQPGETLPEPLVVRLENQFGHPVTGQSVTAALIRGDGAVVSTDATTNAQGEAQFEVQAGASETDLVVEVTAPDFVGVAPAQFFAVVGTLDTPGPAFDLAVADGAAFIADGCFLADGDGLQVIDVQNPMRPALLHQLPFTVVGSGSPGCPASLALQGDRLYMGTEALTTLTVIDVSNPRDAEFAVDDDEDDLPDVVLGSLLFPAQESHFPRAMAVQGRVAYVMTITVARDQTGTLLVVDVTHDTNPTLLSTVDLPVQSPTGLAVANDVVYVGAGEAGLLTLDMFDLAAPRVASTSGDPDPSDRIDHVVIAGPQVAGDFAYLVESQHHQDTGVRTDHLVVLDLVEPLAPIRRGTLLLRGINTTSALPGTRGGAPLAVVGGFAYVTRGTLGLQAIDVSDPDDPRLAGAVQTPGLTTSVFAVGATLYVTDQVFGLQVIQGPATERSDADGDGAIDFFDRFPTNPDEFLDTDNDRIGDHADADDDNDGFTHAEEASARPPTDPLDPRRYPVRGPPSAVTTLVVDASSAASVRERNGTPERPYRSPTEALRVLRNGQAHQVDTIHLRPGLYAPSTTQDIFPLDLSGLSDLTMQGADRDTTVLDAEFRAEVAVAGESANLIFEELTFTEGALGIIMSDSSSVIIRRSRVTHNEGYGILLDPNVTEVTVHDNLVESNGFNGIGVFGGSAATVTQNVSRFNAGSGFIVAQSASADIRDNLSEHNNDFGIIIWTGSNATISDNVVRHNAKHGILVVTDSHATITNNVIEFNDDDGINISLAAAADLLDNTIRGNAHEGVRVAEGSDATISGGVSSQNGGHGIRVGGVVFADLGPATATIGIDGGNVLEVIDNEGAGLFVDDDGSEATIDSRNIEFDGNTEDDLVGNVCDVTVAPCP